MSGKVIIFSAPSGSGKTTFVKHLLQNNSDLGFSVSASTRAKRTDNEQDGKDYYFLTVDDFKKKIKNNEFVEWEEVYEGMFYGTLKSEVKRLWAEGKNVIFDVDVKGGVNLKKYFGDKALSIFVKVPSFEILEKRLRDRGTESAEGLAKRLAKVKSEMAFENMFDIVLVNDDLEESKKRAQRLYDEFKNS